MPLYDTSDWVRVSPCLMPTPPPHVGVGTLEIGKEYPCMNGDTARIMEKVTYEGEDFFVGHIVTGNFAHYFQMNGRDWTDNPNNPYAIDWPTVEIAKGWGS